MQTQIGKVDFVSTVVLISVFYIFLSVAESSLTTRMGFNASNLKLATAATLLVLSVLLDRYMNVNWAVEATSNFGNRQLILAMTGLYVVSLALTFSGSAIPVHRLQINSMELCRAANFDLPELLRTCLVAPAWETIVFVKILPKTFMERYKSINPTIGILIVSALFSVVHSPASIEIFVLRFCVGVIFSYTYFGLGSLIGAFVLHAAHNFALALLGAVDGDVCAFIANLPYQFVITTCVFGLLVTTSVVIKMAKMQWFSRPAATPSH